MILGKRSFVLLLVTAVACGDDDGAHASEGGTTQTTSGASTAAATDLPDEPMPPRADLGIEPPAACDPYCEVLEGCLGQSRSDCLLACSSEHEQREAVGSTCLEAHELELGCVAALDCDDASAWYAGTGSDRPCAAEEQATAVSCTPGVDDPSMACDAFCDTVETCSGQAKETCLAACAQAEQAAADVGAACEAAQEDVFVCASALSCDELAAWAEAEADYPCRSADEAFETACTGE